jgi:hypothetical protein
MGVLSRHYDLTRAWLLERNSEYTIAVRESYTLACSMGSNGSYRGPVRDSGANDGDLPDELHPRGHWLLCYGRIFLGSSLLKHSRLVRFIVIEDLHDSDASYGTSQQDDGHPGLQQSLPHFSQDGSVFSPHSLRI